jgi:hypothetical protein
MNRKKFPNCGLRLRGFPDGPSVPVRFIPPQADRASRHSRAMPRSPGTGSGARLRPLERVLDLPALPSVSTPRARALAVRAHLRAGPACVRPAKEYGNPSRKSVALGVGKRGRRQSRECSLVPSTFSRDRAPSRKEASAQSPGAGGVDNLSAHVSGLLVGGHSSAPRVSPPVRRSRDSQRRSMPVARWS